MDRNAWNAVIDAAHKATEDHGIKVRGGKKYAQVTTRVELFRRHFTGWGMDTEIVSLGHDKGQAVVVRARVLDPDGTVKATGHASEIIGNGGVNTTSALENAETSAIGRALSCLGLHGGEYASLNELEGADRKHAAQQETAPQDRDAETRSRLTGAASLASLQTAWAWTYRAYGNNPPQWAIDMKEARKAALSAGDPQAPADPTEPPF